VTGYPPSARTSCATTYALAAGITSKVVSEDLGHARVQTTENLYVSVLPELKQAAADADTRSRRPTDPDSCTARALQPPKCAASPIRKAGEHIDRNI
jgi:hypothetical protein